MDVEIAPSTWDAYTASVVSVDTPSGRLVATPTDGAPSGSLPDDLPEPWHVVTAWNPGSRILDADANAARDAALRRELDRRHAPWFPARGAAPDGSWHEDGVALVGWDRTDACALARAYDQAAVFELHTGRLVVVSADLATAEARACTITVTRDG